MSASILLHLDRGKPQDHSTPNTIITLLDELADDAHAYLANLDRLRLLPANGDEYAELEGGSTPGSSGYVSTPTTCKSISTPKSNWRTFVSGTPNPVSAEVTRALREAGLFYSEAARRLGTSRQAVARLADPFYWGHSLATLPRLAEVLGLEVEVQLRRAS